MTFFFETMLFGIMVICVTLMVLWVSENVYRFCEKYGWLHIFTCAVLASVCTYALGTLVRWVSVSL